MIHWNTWVLKGHGGDGGGGDGGDERFYTEEGLI